MEFDAAGWLDSAQHVPSANCDERPRPAVIDTLVLHHISLPPEHFRGDAVERLFTNRLDPTAHPFFAQLKDVHVSAHFLVRRHGELLQFVACSQRAWHAGRSRLLERERCNDFSIGVELEGSSRRPFTRTQYRRLVALIVALRRRYPLRYIAGHSDIAPDRKDDPGPFFEWQQLRAVLLETGIERPF